VIQNVLGINVEEPEEIPTAEEGIEIAGFIDRRGKRIVVAQKYKTQWRRFTWAHELAHWILHPALSYRRERPLTGAERNNYQRLPEEAEADAFAAELLMPTKLLNKVFRENFGDPLDGRTPNEDLAFWFTTASATKVDPSELASRGPKYRALLLAQAKSWRGSFLVSLSDRFGVSPSAMAIQLLELGLVR
jgi:Zn-dependent peptidase ImmA (M78 family)